MSLFREDDHFVGNHSSPCIIPGSSKHQYALIRRKDKLPFTWVGVRLLLDSLGTYSEALYLLDHPDMGCLDRNLTRISPNASFLHVAHFLEFTTRRASKDPGSFDQQNKFTLICH
jgi:hypothetical protein